MNSVSLAAVHIYMCLLYTAGVPGFMCIVSPSESRITRHFLSTITSSTEGSSRAANRQAFSGLKRHRCNRFPLASLPSAVDKELSTSNGFIADKESGLTYIADLVNRNVQDEGKRKFTSYTEKCEHIQRSIVRGFPSVMFSYNILLSQKTQPEFRHPGAPLHFESAGALKRKGNMLDTALLGAIKCYLDMTNKGILTKGGWFFSSGPASLSKSDQQVRLEHMIELIMQLDQHLRKYFRDWLTSYKSKCVTKMLMGDNSIARLSEQHYAEKWRREFAKNCSNMVPPIFSVSTDAATIITEIIKYVEKADPSFADLVGGLKGVPADKELVSRLAETVAKWSVVDDVNEFSTIVNKLHSGSKSVLKRQLKSGEKQQKLLQVLESQQQQIEAYQKQLGMKSQRGSQLSCGFSYRMPNSNLNIIGSLQRYVSRLLSETLSGVREIFKSVVYLTKVPVC